MALNQVQPFLEKTFEFLRSKEFSISPESWKTYCKNQGISLENLKKAKAELLRQSPNTSDDTERLQQIFGCDPFDAENVKALRDNWHKKSEAQPDPYQEWTANLSIHLLDLGSTTSGTSSPSTATPPSSSTPKTEPKLVTFPTPSSKIPKELLSAVITGSIIGICIMAAMLITNNANKPSTVSSNTSNVPSPSALPTQNISSPPTPVPQVTSSETSQIPSRSPSLISRQEAVDLIQKWLNAKGQIFAPPYDRNLASEILTGRAYECNLGSIDWLENNGAYYTYGVSRIDEIVNFAENGENATIEVKFTEQRTLHNARGGIDRNASKFGQSRMLYNLRLDNGTWKISYFRLPKC